MASDKPPSDQDAPIDTDNDDQTVTNNNEDEQRDDEYDTTTDAQTRRGIFVRKTVPLSNADDIIARLNRENAHAENKLGLAKKAIGDETWTDKSKKEMFEMNSEQWKLGMAGPLNNRDVSVEERVAQVIAAVGRTRTMTPELAASIRLHFRRNDGAFELTREYAAGRDHVPVSAYNRLAATVDAMRYDAIDEESRLRKKLRDAEKVRKNADLLLKHYNFRGSLDTAMNFFLLALKGYNDAAENLDRATYERLATRGNRPAEDKPDEDKSGETKFGDDWDQSPPPVSLKQLTVMIKTTISELRELDNEAEKITEDSDRVKINADQTDKKVSSLKDDVEYLTSESALRFDGFMTSHDQHAPNVSMEKRLRRHQKVSDLHETLSAYCNTLKHFATEVEQSRAAANTVTNRVHLRHLWTKMPDYGLPLPSQDGTNVGVEMVPMSEMEAVVSRNADLERRLKSERSKVRKLERAEKYREAHDTLALYDSIDSYRGLVAKSLYEDVLEEKKLVDAQAGKVPDILDQVGKAEEMLRDVGPKDINSGLLLDVLCNIRAGLAPMSASIEHLGQSITSVADGLRQDCLDNDRLNSKGWKQAMNVAETEAKDDEISQLKHEVNRRERCHCSDSKGDHGNGDERCEEELKRARLLLDKANDETWKLGADLKKVKEELAMTRESLQNLQDLSRTNGGSGLSADDVCRVELNSVKKKLQNAEDKVERLNRDIRKLKNVKASDQYHLRNAREDYDEVNRLNAKLTTEIGNLQHEILALKLGQHRSRAENDDESEDNGEYTNWDDAERRRQRSSHHIGKAMKRIREKLKKAVDIPKTSLKLLHCRRRNPKPEDDGETSKPIPDDTDYFFDSNRYRHRTPEYVMAQTLLSHRTAILSHISRHEVAHARNCLDRFQTWFHHVNEEYPWANHADWMDSWGAYYFLDAHVTASEAWGARQAGRDWSRLLTRAQASLHRALNGFRRDRRRREETARANPHWLQRDVADDVAWLKLAAMANKLRLKTMDPGPDGVPECECEYRVAHCPRHRGKLAPERPRDMTEEQFEQDRFLALVLENKLNLEILMMSGNDQVFEPGEESDPGFEEKEAMKAVIRGSPRKEGPGEEEAEDLAASLADELAEDLAGERGEIMGERPAEETAEDPTREKYTKEMVRILGDYSEVGSPPPKDRPLYREGAFW